jgi:hypothetical protein
MLTDTPNYFVFRVDLSCNEFCNVYTTRCVVPFCISDSDALLAACGVFPCGLSR